MTIECFQMIRTRDFVEILENVLTAGHLVFLRPFLDFLKVLEFFFRDLNEARFACSFSTWVRTRSTCSKSRPFPAAQHIATVKLICLKHSYAFQDLGLII